MIFMVLSAITPVLTLGFWRLAFIGEFAFGPTGHSGTVSSGERHFHAVAGSPTGTIALRLLYHIGNPQAKAYALVGLRDLDFQAYEPLWKDFRSSQKDVMWMAGCVVTPEPAQHVAHAIEEGRENAILSQSISMFEPRANQSVEPTSAAGSVRADARSEPAAPVAHQ